MGILLEDLCRYLPAFSKSLVLEGNHHHVRICLLRSTGALARHHVGFQSIPNVADRLVLALGASHCVAFARALALHAAYNMLLTVPEKPGRVLVHNVLYASFPPANVAQHTDSLCQSCIL